VGSPWPRFEVFYKELPCLLVQLQVLAGSLTLVVQGAALIELLAE